MSIETTQADLDAINQYMTGNYPQPLTNQSPHGIYESPMRMYSSSITQLTSTDDEMEKLDMALRAIQKDQNGNVVQIGQPLMNDLGVTSVISQTQVIVNRVTIMSHLDDHNIPILMELLADSLIKDLMDRQRYEIRTPMDRDKIFYMVMASAYIAMRRAYMEGERHFWKNSQQEITMRSEGQGSQKKGFLSTIMGWRNK
jgi:hypothetical protein